MTHQIRTVAVAICRAGNRILLERGYDAVKDEHFYRAIGGGVEVGERAVDAAIREWREEFELSLETPKLLGVLENFFTFEGRAGHEIVSVFEGQVCDRRLLEQDELETVDTDGAKHVAVWVSVEALRDGKTSLYPDGMLQLILGAD